MRVAAAAYGMQVRQVRDGARTCTPSLDALDPIYGAVGNKGKPEDPTNATGGHTAVAAPTGPCPGHEPHSRAATLACLFFLSFPCRQHKERIGPDDINARSEAHACDAASWPSRVLSAVNSRENLHVFGHELIP